MTEFELFEVFDNQGIRVFHTEYQECVPDIDQLKAMQKAGYKFRYNGRKTSLKALQEVFK